MSEVTDAVGAGGGKSCHDGWVTQEQSTAVVEFGAEEAEKESRRAALARFLHGARLDDRAVPAIAGLGAVAVFVSFVTEWQATSMDVPQGEFDFGLAQDIGAGLGDLGSWGAGYLMGVFAVVAASTLAVFGAPAVRRHARLAGLGIAGTLIALLIAITAQLGRDSLIIPGYYIAREEPATSYRSGLYLAFAGVAALGVALYLVGRLPAHRSGEAEETTEEQPQEATPDDYWRRNGEPAPPADLTVQPAAPFVQLPER